MPGEELFSESQENGDSLERNFSEAGGTSTDISNWFDDLKDDDFCDIYSNTTEGMEL
jgi:hypothetical protein